jgi:hypothetical protein
MGWDKYLVACVHYMVRVQNIKKTIAKPKIVLITTIIITNTIISIATKQQLQNQ